MPDIVLEKVKGSELANKIRQLDPEKMYRVSIKVLTGKKKRKRQLSCDDDIPLTEINAASESFAFLENEPDLYTMDDLKKRYV